MQRVSVWVGLLGGAIAGCSLLRPDGASWQRPYPLNQVIPTAQYQMLLSPRRREPGTDIRFCLKRTQPLVPVANARVMASVGLLDQSVQLVELRYNVVLGCYEGWLPQPLQTTRGFLLYVQIGQERHQWRFR